MKLPGFDIGENYLQIVDYMLDLRNSFGVRFAFGLLSTYKHWRLFWFADTHTAAMETSRVKYDEMCQAASASENFITSSTPLTLYATKVYDSNDPKLIEMIITLMYKVSKGPVASPSKYTDKRWLYVYAKPAEFTF